MEAVPLDLLKLKFRLFALASSSILCLLKSLTHISNLCIVHSTLLLDLRAMSIACSQIILRI